MFVMSMVVTMAMAQDVKIVRDIFVDLYEGSIRVEMVGGESIFTTRENYKDYGILNALVPGGRYEIRIYNGEIVKVTNHGIDAEVAAMGGKYYVGQQRMGYPVYGGYYGGYYGEPRHHGKASRTAAKVAAGAAGVAVVAGVLSAILK